MLAAAVLAAIASACQAGPVARGPTPTPSAGGELTPTQARYRLIDRFGPPYFCDPDYYPVAREGGEEQNARDWYASADHNGDEVRTIFARLHITGHPSDAQVLAAYREHKRLQAIELDAAGDRFRFLIRIQIAKGDVVDDSGTIRRDGTINVTSRKTERFPSCPICLSGATLIDTPAGAVPVARLRPGAPIWTVDAAGRREQGIVLPGTAI